MPLFRPTRLVLGVRSSLYVLIKNSQTVLLPRKMRPHFLLIPLFAFLIGCNSSSSVPQVFNGRFVSDREATIARWQETQPWGNKTAEFTTKLSPILGTTQVVANGKNYTTTAEDWEEKGEREFLSIEGNTAEIRSYSTIWRRDIISRIEADTTGYWLYSDEPVPGYHERFTRRR